MVSSNENTFIADKAMIDKITPSVQTVAPDEEPQAEAFVVTTDDNLMSAKEVAKELVRKGMRCFDSEALHDESFNDPRRDSTKSVVDGSNQPDADVADALGYGVSVTGENKIVIPPYPPTLMSKFLEVDETHFRCVKTKVTDSIGRRFDIVPVERPKDKKKPGKNVEQDKADAVSKAEETIIRDFIDECNDVIGFDGVLSRAGMDYEGIGWGAIEVIRSLDMKVARIAHIPASRVRVIRGWQGFVELIGPDKFLYYQPFGKKVVSNNRTSPITGKPEPYHPRMDGELNSSNAKLQMIDRETGQPTSNVNRAANEILWIPKHHSNTVYYGLSDLVPAIGWLLANVHIRDYLLQFFEYNTVPQYAVIIEGARLSTEVKDTIMEFFKTHVKGKAHSTLIIPIPAMGGEVKVRFEKLGADAREGSFQETRKNNAQGIMTAHGVSPAIIGIADSSELGSGKGLSQAEIYKDRIVTPAQGMWARVLNKLFKLGLGIRTVELEFDPLDIRDMEAEQRVLSGYLKDAVITRNEVRKSAKLGDPIEGGDRPFQTGGPLLFIDEVDKAESSEIVTLDLEKQTVKSDIASSATSAKASLIAARNPPKVAPTGNVNQPQQSKKLNKKKKQPR